MLKKYIYHGPLSSITLTIEGKAQDIILMNGKQVMLPDDDDYTQTLVNQGKLVQVAEEPKATVSESTPTTTSYKKGAK